MFAVSISLGPAGYAHPLLVNPSTWIGWARAPYRKHCFCVVQCHAPKAFPSVCLCPALRVLVLGGLVPLTETAALGGLPLTSNNFHDFHIHGLLTRDDGISAISVSLFLRGSASVATSDGCTALRSFSYAADTVFVSGSAVGTKCARAPRKPWLQRRTSPR